MNSQVPSALPAEHSDAMCIDDDCAAFPEGLVEHEWNNWDDENNENIGLYVMGI